jgi:hypothetical protein
MSLPKSNITTTFEIPVIETDLTSLTPGMPFKADSIGNETSASTSSGASPGASVRTVTWGGAKSGKTSTSDWNETIRPAITKKSDRTTTMKRSRIDHYLKTLAASELSLLLLHPIMELPG